jgi:hypothetical protein
VYSLKPAHNAIAMFRVRLATQRTILHSQTSELGYDLLVKKLKVTNPPDLAAGYGLHGR